VIGSGDSSARRGGFMSSFQKDRTEQKDASMKLGVNKTSTMYRQSNLFFYKYIF
jgi:hypothetical protein